MAKLISKIKCSTCGKIFYYPLLKSCFHCGRKVQNRNISIPKVHDFYLSISSLFIILMSYKLFIIADYLNIILFSIIFLSLSTWNYYFKNKYRTKFVLPLKLRFYLLVTLIILNLTLQNDFKWSIFSFVLFGFIFSIKFINWMEISAKDLNSVKILNLTTFVDTIQKELYQQKKIYIENNLEITRYYYKCLWGIKKYSIIEFITKFIILTKSMQFYTLIVIVGILLILFEYAVDSLFPFLPQNVELLFLVIIFTVDSIKSFSNTNKIDLKNKNITRFDLIIKIIKKGNFVEYCYLLIFGFSSYWFFLVSITLIYVLINVNVNLNTSDYLLYATYIFATEFIFLYYIINLKTILINFVTNNEKIPKYTEFLSIFVLLSPVFISIDDKETKVYLIISLLFVSIIIANNYIYRKYIKYESLPITKKTTAIFGVIGIIILFLKIEQWLFFPLISILIVIKFYQTFSNKTISSNNLKEYSNKSWNFHFKIYIIMSSILIMTVIHAILYPPVNPYFIKILFIVMFIFLLIVFIIIDGNRKNCIKSEKELIKDAFKRAPLIFRILGMDGPFLKERDKSKYK